ncbi:unnamed protein product, partial [marine sediment metagenome]
LGCLTKHPDWCKHDKAGNPILKNGLPTGGHCNAHAVLLASKLFVKHMWLEWWGDDAPSKPYAGQVYETEKCYGDAIGETEGRSALPRIV